MNNNTENEVPLSSLLSASRISYEDLVDAIQGMSDDEKIRYRTTHFFQASTIEVTHSDRANLNAISLIASRDHDEETDKKIKLLLDQIRNNGIFVGDDDNPNSIMRTRYREFAKVVFKGETVKL